jgi:hypothetical protein
LYPGAVAAVPQEGEVDLQDVEGEVDLEIPEVSLLFPL